MVDKRTLNLSLLLVTLALLVAAGIQAADDPPDKLVFESKMGNVTFDHATHVERQKEECTNCHDKLFPQSREPLNFKAGMHKPAEAKKASCAGCHVAGGQAFESKGKCNTCHVKKK